MLASKKSSSRRIASVDELREKAAALCVRAEQCEYDIRIKLSRWGANADAVDSIIDFLYGHNFLNADRYAESFARDKALFSGWGRLKILAALRMKRIDEDCAYRGIEEGIDNNDYVRILEDIAANKAKHMDLTDFKERHKLITSLRARGYEADLVTLTVDKICKE